ncbi:hypothetical protein NZ47_04625 [Anaerovibrio lipolyticus]|uniref:Uncharacterized protein n=1 Tax=Anaerovibrio lipolyticus TaxID=82374 RepID=A0A0B2JY06_9FIRM|nr:glycosyltransferase family 2 protein [Anaerovibrio lipolyticus]KHM52484.1 hypothetical protein NZ47_04625 [Anaerovibrio lipolyticus]
MSEKIIVVSMAKNEADIIESFVRYYMTFADGIIIVDHNSDDDTGKILAELQKEYPSLIVDQLKTIEHVQSEVMTNLVKIAANELGAGWVLPLDIDEYLIPRDGADCRSLLNNITDDVISLNWIEHELVDMEHERDVFLLNRLCNRSSKVNVMTKIFLKGSFVQNNNIRLIQGNHGVMKLAENDSESLAYAPRCSEFILAHFPFRSREQYVSKHAIGWLTSAMKYSVTTIAATNWKRAFDKICENDYEIPKIKDAKFVGKMFEENIALKYTDSKPINVLSRVMQLAEKICDKYARETAVHKLSTITVIMPLGHDFDAAVDTIGSLLNQTIRDWKLFIIAPNDIDERVRTALIECDGRISVVGINNDIVPEGFVKLISPGRKLSSDCLEKEAIALEIHREFNINVTYSNGKDAMGADVVVDHFCAQDGTDIWNGIKDTPYSLTGGVSGMMLRNIPQDLQLPEVIENYQWQEKEILGKLLPGKLFLVFSERFV